MKNGKNSPEWIGKLKQIGLDKFILLLIAGVLLIFSGGNSTNATKEKKVTPSVTTVSEYDFETKTEARLKKILESAYGTGKVEVMITMEETEQKILATLQDECIFDGDTPYVVKNESPKIRGVVVVIEETKQDAALEITKACEVLLGISSNRIRVIYKK